MAAPESGVIQEASICLGEAHRRYWGGADRGTGAGVGEETRR